MTMENKDISAKVSRWALLLSEFHCSVVHRSGTTMRHVDALSRYPVVAQLVDVDAGLLERVRASQRKDKNCDLIRTILESGKQHRDYVLRRGLVYRLVDGGHQLVVPKVMQRQVIRAVHEKGHVGANQVAAIVQRDYCIDRLRARCLEVIANCLPCILATRKAGKQEGTR